MFFAESGQLMNGHFGGFVAVNIRARRVHYENNISARHLKRLYEPGVVRALKIQKRSALARNPRQLGPGFFRILISSAGEPDRIERVERASTQDLAGMHHPNRIYFDIVRVVSFAHQMELLRFLRLDRRRRLLRLQILNRRHPDCAAGRPPINDKSKFAFVGSSASVRE
jgi:hypothetical protein